MGYDKNTKPACSLLPAPCSHSESQIAVLALPIDYFLTLVVETGNSLSVISNDWGHVNHNWRLLDKQASWPSVSLL